MPLTAPCSGTATPRQRWRWARAAGVERVHKLHAQTGCCALWKQAGVQEELHLPGRAGTQKALCRRWRRQRRYRPPPCRQPAPPSPPGCLACATGRSSRRRRHSGAGRAPRGGRACQTCMRAGGGCISATAPSSRGMPVLAPSTIHLSGQQSKPETSSCRSAAWAHKRSSCGAPARRCIRQPAPARAAGQVGKPKGGGQGAGGGQRGAEGVVEILGQDWTQAKGDKRSGRRAPSGIKVERQLAGLAPAAAGAGRGARFRGHSQPCRNSGQHTQQHGRPADGEHAKRQRRAGGLPLFMVSSTPYEQPYTENSSQVLWLRAATQY